MAQNPMENDFLKIAMYRYFAKTIMLVAMYRYCNVGCYVQVL